MNLGAFSISLAVKDIVASRDFYAKLGFVSEGEIFQEAGIDHVRMVKRL